MKINSTDNSQVKYLKKLQISAGFRREEGKFLIEGQAAIKSLLEKGIRPLHLYLCPEFAGNISFYVKACDQYSIPFTELSQKCFRKISDVESPQGAAALFTFPNNNIQRILDNKRAMFLCCYGIQDPGNLGTMIRTAEAAGASAVIALPPCVSFYNPKVVRASAGSVLSIPCIEMEEKEFSSNIKRKRINLYAAVPRNGKPFYAIRFQKPAGILIGSEAHGIPPHLKTECRLVTIPMQNAVESLNAAVSAAILLYQTCMKKEK